MYLWPVSLSGDQLARSPHSLIVCVVISETKAQVLREDCQFFSCRPLTGSRVFDSFFVYLTHFSWYSEYYCEFSLSNIIPPFSIFLVFFSPLLLWVARNSDSKLTWSPGSVTNTSLAHELWKVPLPPKNITAPSRPPPGLTGQKPPLSTWDNSPLRVGGGWGNSDARYTPGRTQ